MWRYLRIRSIPWVGAGHQKGRLFCFDSEYTRSPLALASLLSRCPSRGVHIPGATKGGFLLFALPLAACGIGCLNKALLVSVRDDREDVARDVPSLVAVPYARPSTVYIFNLLWCSVKIEHAECGDTTTSSEDIKRNPSPLLYPIHPMQYVVQPR